jgi:hypothetical protein
MSDNPTYAKIEFNISLVNNIKKKNQMKATRSKFEHFTKNQHIDTF